MRILLEPSDPELSNLGDAAMLRTTFTRLRKFWPNARIDICTNSVTRLNQICPGAHPILTTVRIAPSSPPTDGILRTQLASGVREGIGGLKAWARERSPRLTQTVRQAGRLLFPHPGPRPSVPLRETEDYLAALRAADVLVVQGMGLIADVFAESARGLLNAIEMAHTWGVDVIMLGQGIGPISGELRSHTGAALKLARLIALREWRAGLPLLRSLGIPEDLITLTGDDAIELAYMARGEALGHAIGINVRGAPSIHSCYSGIDDRLVRQIAAVVQAIRRKWRVPVIPVPIARSPANDDAQTIRRMLGDGGTHVTTVEQALAQVVKCRLVITGSYHAAVFALSAGIPAIGLAKSAYYVDKFLGLQHAFGASCDLVHLDDPNWPGKLIAAVEHEWESADELRPKLLDSARRQIEMGHRAYRAVFELVEARRRTLAARAGSTSPGIG